jgi:hypothetical protein
VTSAAGSEETGADAPGADASSGSGQSVAKGTDPESPDKG